MFHEERKKSYWLIALCVVLFPFGLFLRDWISIKENPIFGNVLYIVMGNLLMAVSLIGIAFLMRRLYRLHKKEKRKKSGSKIHFLDKNEGKKPS